LLYLLNNMNINKNEHIYCVNAWVMILHYRALCFASLSLALSLLS